MSPFSARSLCSEHPEGVKQDSLGQSAAAQPRSAGLGLFVRNAVEAHAIHPIGGLPRPKHSAVGFGLGKLRLSTLLSPRPTGLNPHDLGRHAAAAPSHRVLP